MLRVIIKREIQEYLKSTKFLIGFLVTVVLITVSTFINLNDYLQRRADYLAAVEEMKGDMSYFRVFRAPEVLSVFAQGKDRKLGNCVELSNYNLPYGTTGYMGSFNGSRQQRVMAGFEAVDFAFVVRVVLSLMVIFLAYNSVSEEKFNGTLKLSLSNSLPRDQLLLGKFLGGSFVVLGSLAVAALMALLIMATDPGISLGPADWVRILGLLGVSALYLTGFYALSMFVSVATSRPAISLIVLLQVWVFLLIIYPNLGAISANKWFKLPSEQEVSRQKEAAVQPYDKEIKETSAAMRKSFASGERPSSELALRNMELLIKKAELNYQVIARCGGLFTAQARLSRNLSILSTAVLYDEVMSRFTLTGMDQYERFLDAVPRHWQQHVEQIMLVYVDREAFRKSTPPEFGYSRENTLESLTGSAPGLIILFLFSAIFFMLAYTAFLRKDVR